MIDSPTGSTLAVRAKSRIACSSKPARQAGANRPPLPNCRHISGRFRASEVYPWASPVLDGIVAKCFIRKFLVTGAPLLFVMHSVSLAQPTSPTFEVASVKPAVKVLPGANGSGATGFAASSDAALVRYSGVSFKWLLTKAFQTSEFAISGPSWIDTEKYDVVAKLPDGAKKSDIPAMLQQLLAERFHLVVRQHEKVQRDYAMVVGKSGLLRSRSQPQVVALRLIDCRSVLPAWPLPICPSAVWLKSLDSC